MPEEYGRHDPLIGIRLRSTMATQAPPVPTESTKEALAGAFIRWIFLGIVVALAPVLASWGDGILIANDHFHFEDLVDQGELLIVTAAILGAALAELLAHEVKREFRHFRTVAGLLAGVLLLGAAVWFAEIQASLRDRAALNLHRVAVDSLWLFGFAVVIGASCVAVAQFEDGR